MSWVTRRAVASHGLAAVGMSLPWPLLVLLVWERAGDGWVLGAAGAARMVPYVALSWAAGRLADRVARDRIVRLTLAARTVLMVVAAVSLAAGETWVAFGAATCAVAVATPAYPALAAAMPGLAGRHRERATGLLVTSEVASFVVGPALGGLMLAPATRELVPWVGAVLLAAALLLFDGIRLPAPEAAPTTTRSTGVVGALRGSRVLRGALVAVSVVNAVAACVGLAMLPLAEGWSGPGRGAAFGIATAALGFGALGGPVLDRLGHLCGLGPRTWLVVLAACLAGVALAPSLWMAVPLLTVAGAAAVQLEIVATALVQTAAPDRLRASVLGVADTSMVGAALLGALVAPVLASTVGPRVVVLAAAAASLGAVTVLRRAEPVALPVEEPRPVAV